MALLCKPCHGKVTNKYIAKEDVASARRNPRVLSTGVTSELFHIKPPVIISFGKNTFKNINAVVATNAGDTWFKISEPIEDGQPIFLNAKFYGKDGSVICELRDNEWVAFASNWDVTFIGGVLTILEGRRNIRLRLKFEAPHSIQIDRLKMDYLGSGICVEPSGKLTITSGASSISVGASELLSAEAIFTLNVRPEGFQALESACFRNLYNCSRCSRYFNTWVSHEHQNTRQRCPSCDGEGLKVPCAPTIIARSSSENVRDKPHAPNTYPLVPKQRFAGSTAIHFDGGSNNKIGTARVSGFDTALSIRNSDLQVDRLETVNVKRPVVVIED